jgi:hypothetical protein
VIAVKNMAIIGTAQLICWNWRMMTYLFAI